MASRIPRGFRIDALDRIGRGRLPQAVTIRQEGSSMVCTGLCLAGELGRPLHSKADDRPDPESSLPTRDPRRVPGSPSADRYRLALGDHDQIVRL